MSTHDLDADLAIARRLAAARGDGRPFYLDAIVAGPSGLESLAPLVQRFATPGDIVILEDATPMVRNGADLKALVASLVAAVGSVRRAVLGPPDGAVHADSATIAAAVAAATGAGCLVVVGSGTMTDIAKLAAEANEVALVAVQTAASVNGYADDMAVILRDGVKRTVPTVWPRALVIDTAVLAGAPAQLTRSGYAEMMAMFTAPADWRLAAAVGHDPSFDRETVDLFRRRGGELLQSAPGIRVGVGKCLDLLANALTLSGLAMGLAGRTAVMSGTEHLISHMIDMSAAVDGRPVGLHGAQVGVSTVVAACLWQRLVAQLDPDDLLAPEPDPDEMRGRVEAAFAKLDPSGRTAAECWADYQRKLRRWTADRAGRASLARDWPSVRNEITGLLGDPALIVDSLREAGAPQTFRQLATPIDPARVRWAVGACHLMRDRFTVVDLAFLTGHWRDEDVDAVLARAAELVGGQ